MLQVQHEKHEGKEKEGVLRGIVCVTRGLSALRHVPHFFGNVVHVSDVRPLLGIRVDARVYQVPELEGEMEEGRI